LIGGERERDVALIKCRECGKDVSTEAATCPHCGAPTKPIKSTPTTRQDIAGPISAGNAFCGLLSLIGVIFLFIAWPVGLSMLIVSGFIGLFTKNKKIAVLVGDCPHCAAAVRLPVDSQGAPCPICKTPFLSRNGRFEEIRA
jgi:ribosomal protein L37E